MILFANHDGDLRWEEIPMRREGFVTLVGEGLWNRFRVQLV